MVTSYSSKNDLGAGGKILYRIAGLAICLAVLAGGGIISARSDIGTVSVTALTHYDAGELQHTVAEGYASNRLTGPRPSPCWSPSCATVSSRPSVARLFSQSHT